jgi:uncharacterized protein YdiU (UPF0061 family)
MIFTMTYPLYTFYKEAQEEGPIYSALLDNSQCEPQSRLKPRAYSGCLSSGSGDHSKRRLGFMSKTTCETGFVKLVSQYANYSPQNDLNTSNRHLKDNISIYDAKYRSLKRKFSDPQDVEQHRAELEERVEELEDVEEQRDELQERVHELGEVEEQRDGFRSASTS